MERKRQRPPSIKDIKQQGYIREPAEAIDWSARKEQNKADGNPYSVSIKNIDEVVFYYFKEVIRPAATKYNTFTDVPVFYYSPEKWKAVQEDGQYRDKNGKMQLPVITFIRTRLEKDRTLGYKVNVPNPLTAIVTSKTNSSQNWRREYSKINNAVPVTEYQSVVVPTFVNLYYNCIILNNYVEDANILEEVINYYTDNYWGIPESFSFMTTADSFSTSIETLSDGDRVIKTDFELRLRGYLLPSSVNTPNQGQLKKVGPNKVTITEKIV